MVPFYGWGSTASRLQSQNEYAVYFRVVLKVPCWLNLLHTGEKYCKRYTLSESEKVKTRNSKFELLVGKFISLHYFPNASLTADYVTHSKKFSIPLDA